MPALLELGPDIPARGAGEQHDELRHALVAPVQHGHERVGPFHRAWARARRPSPTPSFWNEPTTNA